jgi:hypothetical protein
MIAENIFSPAPSFPYFTFPDFPEAFIFSLNPITMQAYFSPVKE